MPSMTYLAKSFWISTIFTFPSYYPGHGGDIANIVNSGILQACTLLSSSLVQQGGLLGPLLSALALHPIISELNQECNSLSLWYLDDGTLAVPLEDVINALSTLNSYFLPWAPSENVIFSARNCPRIYHYEIHCHPRLSN